MPFEDGRQQRATTIDASTELDEECLEFFISDNEIERELDTSPFPQRHVNIGNMISPSSTAHQHLRSLPHHIKDTKVSLMQAETHKQAVSYNESLEYPVLPLSPSRNQSASPDRVLFLATPISQVEMKYPVLPCSSPEIVSTLTGWLGTPEYSGFGSAPSFVSVQQSCTIDRDNSRKIGMKVVQILSDTVVQDEEGSIKTTQPSKDYGSVCVETSRIQTTIRPETHGNEGGPQIIQVEEPAIYDKKESADITLAEMYANYFNFSEIDLTKATKLEGHISKDAAKNPKDAATMLAEDNAFIKFYLGISTYTASFDATIVPETIKLPSAPSQSKRASKAQQGTARGGAATYRTKGSFSGTLLSKTQLCELQTAPSVAETDEHCGSQTPAAFPLCHRPRHVDSATTSSEPGMDCDPKLAPPAMQERTLHADQPPQSCLVPDSREGPRLQPSRMSPKLLAHLPKTDTRLNAQTLKHLEWAYEIWYPDPKMTASVALQNHAREFDEPDWTEEEWLGIEQKAIGNAYRERRA
ncbi:hypothetical protein MMC18_002824 [Xylographa bjoerkii]|nr:hypothetical protein [Xylographa bjoerkii]